MGFGYNPDLVRFGERLDILSFFSWMKRLEGTLEISNWTIFDASSYMIVNRTPQKKITALGEKPTAEQILDVLIEQQERPKRAEMMQNCDARAAYLQRLIQISSIEGKYVDSRVVFRESAKYRDALDLALWYVEKLTKDQPELVRRIQPANRNPASQLYLPLEIAEAVYLREVGGVQCKFGPITEKDFDEAIVSLLEERLFAYQTLRCPIGPRKPGYLQDRNVIWTSSPDWFVTQLLGNDQPYCKFVASYLQPFRESGESVGDCAIRMREQLRLEEVL